MPHKLGLRIMAIGDIDNDGHQDIVTIDDDQSSFTVHNYLPDQMKFNQSRNPVDIDTNE